VPLVARAPASRAADSWGRRAGKARVRRLAGQSTAVRNQDGHTRELRSLRGLPTHSAGSHPDLRIIEPEEDKQQISIDQIRQTCEALGMTAFRAATRWPLSIRRTR